jgi:3'-5' exoribonuclease
MKKMFAADLVAGAVVDDVFVLASKSLREYAKGWFLSLVLSDRTGSINAIQWEDAESIDRSFKPGDLVRVSGTVSSYNGAPQIRLERIGYYDRRQADLSDFIESLPNPEDVLRRLRELLDTVNDVWLKRLNQAFLADSQFMQQFQTAAAAKAWHHAFRGGLLKHTTELVELAAAVAPHFPEARRDFLLTGAFLHDVGKIHELETDLVIEYSTVGRLVGHVVLGNQMALDKMREIPDFPAEHRLLLQHLILSHQGELEFASPVVPKALEAILLHHLDDLNAQTTAFLRIIRESRERGAEWSEYQRLINRQIWTGAGAASES